METDPTELPSKMNMSKIRLLQLALVLCFLPLIVSCGKPKDGYLYNGTIANVVPIVSYIRWVEQNGTLTGDMQMAYTVNGVVQTLDNSFSGIKSGNQVSLDIRGQQYIGTLQNDALLIDISLGSMGMQELQFAAASIDDYNSALATLKESAGATATAIQNEQATAYVASIQATAIARKQQAVTDANASVANDLSSLNGYISNLEAAATFSSVFSGYAQTWQQMQNDYQTEVNNSKNGCGNGNYNYGIVQYDAGVVQYDEGIIQYDDGVYDYQKRIIDGSYSNVQSAIATLKGDWQTLQQAVANNSGAEPLSNYQQSDIDNAVASGNNALASADSVIKQAEQDRATYDSEANNLNNQAQALLAGMHC